MEQGGCLSINEHLAAFGHERFQKLPCRRGDRQKIRQDNGLIGHLPYFEQWFSIVGLDDGAPFFERLLVTEIKADLMCKQLPFKIQQISVTAGDGRRLAFWAVGAAPFAGGGSQWMDDENFPDRPSLADEIADAAAVVRHLLVVVPIWLVIVYVRRIGAFATAAERIEDSVDGTVVDAEARKMVEHVPLAAECHVFGTDAVHFRQNLLLAGLAGRRTALQRRRVQARIHGKARRSRLQRRAPPVHLCRKIIDTRNIEIFIIRHRRAGPPQLRRQRVLHHQMAAE